MSGTACGAVRTVATPAMSEGSDDNTTGSSDPRVLRLTEGQRACLRLVLEHKTSKEIALALGISPDTVDKRLKTAVRTLGVHGRVAAAMMVREHGVAPEGYQRLVYQPPDLGPVPRTGEVEASTNRWSDHDAPVTTAEIRDTGPAVEWSSAEIKPDRAVHGAGWTGFDVGIPWGTLNTLRVQQRLILILVIAVLSALAFSSIVGSLEAFRPVL